MAKSKKGLKINFGDTPKEIRRGTQAKHVPEGDYLLKIVEHEVRKSRDETGKYISWRFTVAKGPQKGATLYDITSLKPQALFNLRNLIHAATGKNVAGKVVNFDPTSIYGKIVAATVQDDEVPSRGEEGDDDYKPPRMKSRPVDYRPKEELNLDEEEEEEEESDDEEEEEDEEEDEDLEDVDVEEL